VLIQVLIQMLIQVLNFLKFNPFSLLLAFSPWKHYASVPSELKHSVSKEKKQAKG
jgi:hypothetical protein